MTNLIERIITRAGSEDKLASLVGVSQPAINKAKKRGRVSPALALSIEAAFPGEFTKEELRPDIFIPKDGAAA